VQPYQRAMAAKRSKLPPLSTDQKRLRTSAKKLLSDIAAYVADGGGSLDEVRNTEIKFFRRRDKLYDLARSLGLLEDPLYTQLSDEVRAATKAMPDAARATRERGYEAEMRRIRQMEQEHRSKMSGYDRELQALRNRGKL